AAEKKAQGMTIAPGPVPMQPDGDPKDAKGQNTQTLTQWMFVISNSLAELNGRMQKVETLVSTLVLQANNGKVDVAAKPPEKRTKEQLEKSAQEVLANNKPDKNGKEKLVKDVPDLDVIVAQANAYVKVHGRKALETRMAQYKVDKLGKLTDEQ